MDRPHGDDSPGVPQADTWLAGGASALAIGIWLLGLGDPYLLTLWGVGLVLMGSVAVIVGLGMLLRIWE